MKGREENEEYDDDARYERNETENRICMTDREKDIRKRETERNNRFGRDRCTVFVSSVKMN